MFEAFKEKLGAAKAAVNSPKAPPETGVHVLDGSPAVVDSRCAKLTVAGFEVEGVSIAGQETCIIVPRAKVAFDIGRCPQRAVFQQTLLISHGHLDHIGGVPFHVASRAMQGLSPSKVVVPPSYKDGLERYIGIADELQGNRPTEYEVLPLKPGEEIMLPSGFIARPFPTTHTIASQGYLLYSMRKKLKAELVGQSQDQIRELRSTGAEVTDCVRVPEVAFTGDTTAEFLENPEVPDDVFKARLLIMEMSFIDDAVSVEEAREKGHMHIADFVAHAHKFQNECIMLIHFSARYKRSYIIEALNTWLPPALRAKCVPLLNGYSD